jgi:4-amino-4-deoxy-L-arabinose transferase-like glycosyltransferase
LLWAALSREWRAPFRFLHPLIIVVFCVTALPWYIVCALRNPDFLRVFIWQHNFERYLTPIFEHRQPFWYYGPILLVAIFPWILFLIGAIRDSIRSIKKEKDYDSPELFFVFWMAFPVLFFSISQSKLPGYILPTAPPLFLLLANWLSGAMPDRTKSVLRLLGWTGALFLPLAIPAIAEIAGGRSDIYYPGYVVAEGVAFTFGIVVVVLAFRRLPIAALLALVFLVVSSLLVAETVVLPRLDKQISVRAFAKKLRDGDLGVENVATYRLSRNWQYGFNYYFNRALPEWSEGSDKPLWILSGTLPDQQVLDRNRLRLDDSALLNREIVYVFHRY